MTPRATKTFNEIKHEAAKYYVPMAGNGKFHVSGPYMDQYDVNVYTRECTCRKWQLIGMPCKHGVAAMEHGTKWVYNWHCGRMG